MAKSSISTARKALAFATEIQIVAMTKSPHPRAEQIVQQAVARIRKEFGHSRDLKKSQIVAFIRSDDAGGSVSISDLEERFQWRGREIYDLVAELCDGISPQLERVKQQIVANGPRGGRPATRYRLRDG